METVFMTRDNCRFMSPPPPSQPHYHPTRTRPLTSDEKKVCLSPYHHTDHIDEANRDHHSNKTTPTTHWNLEPVFDGENDRIEGEEESEISSHYNECWHNSTTTTNNTAETTVLTETAEDEVGEGVEKEEGERAGQGERGESRDCDRVDGATGQSTIAKYIERFRRGPPTPREGRRQDQLSGSGSDFWWHGPPCAPLNSDPSRPQSHSTPTNSSTSATTSQQSLSLDSGRSPGEDVSGGGSNVSSLEERSQHVLQKSSSLLATATIPTSKKTLFGSYPTIPRTHPPTYFPPHHLTPSLIEGKGGEEEDILYQWRLRRRLEQAHRATTSLTAKLDMTGPPLFKSQSTRDSGCNGMRGNSYQSSKLTYLPTDNNAETQNQHSRTPLPHQVHTNQYSHHPSEAHHHQHPPEAHPPEAHPPEAHPHHPSEAHHHKHLPEDCPPNVHSSNHPPPPQPPHHTSDTPCINSIPHHTHTMCDIIPCPHSHSTAHSHYHQRKREKKKKKKNSKIQKKDLQPIVEEQHPTSHPSCGEDIDCSHHPPTSSHVRYPSPSLLDHMRQSSQSHDHRHTKPHLPSVIEEDSEEVSLSETIISTSITSSPAISPTPGLVTQTVKRHLFQEEGAMNESFTLKPGDYDDMGDSLLSALITTANALVDQLRKIHSVLSSVDEEEHS